MRVSILHLSCIWCSCETLQGFVWNYPVNSQCCDCHGSWWLLGMASSQATATSWASQSEERKSPNSWEKRRDLPRAPSTTCTFRTIPQNSRTGSELYQPVKETPTFLLGGDTWASFSWSLKGFLAKQHNKSVPDSYLFPGLGKGLQRRATLPAQESKGCLISVGGSWQSWVEKGAMALFVSQGSRVPSSAITETKWYFPPFILSFIHLFTNKIFLGTYSTEDAKMMKIQ